MNRIITMSKGNYETILKAKPPPGENQPSGDDQFEVVASFTLFQYSESSCHIFRPASLLNSLILVVVIMLPVFHIGFSFVMPSGASFALISP